MTIFKNTKERAFLNELLVKGEETYFVGGCVRDYVISESEGVPFSFEDIDITTSATPDKIREILNPLANEMNFVGVQFGTMIVDGVEISQFRRESYEGETNKPQVSLSSSVEEDSSRRDFTMNALYMGLEGDVLDFHGGLEDINTKLIRAIGNPLERFQEDSSRILRMFYLAARFNFEIEEKTLQVAKEHADLIDRIPEELKGKILKKVLSYNVLSRYVRLISEADLLYKIFPELAHTKGMLQNPEYHMYDVLEHTIRVVEASEKYFPMNTTLALASLYHDCAKGLEGVRGLNNRGLPNDLNHEEFGFPIAYKTLIRLQFGRQMASAVSFIVKHHGIRLEPKFRTRSYLKRIRECAADSHDREQLNINIQLLLDFVFLDSTAFAPELSVKIQKDLEITRPIMLDVLNQNIFYIRELPINGNELIELGVPANQTLRTILESLVLNNVKEKEKAISIAKKFAVK